MKRRIRLRGISNDVEGKFWESEALLRVGRLATLDIALDESSVSRRHAEIRATPAGWRVRDLGSTNGIYLNGKRVDEAVVAPRDELQIGDIRYQVVANGSKPDMAVLTPDNRSGAAPPDADASPESSAPSPPPATDEPGQS